MNILKIIPIVALTWTLTGCYVMRSNVNPEARLSAHRQGFVSKAKPEAIPASLNRILVVVKVNQSDESYSEQFVRQFPTHYQICTLSLNPQQPASHAESIRDRVTECQSDAVLIVEQTYKGKFLSVDAPDGDDFSQHSFEMRSVTTNQAFWKAVATTGRLRSSVSARALVSRLRHDGIINGEIPEQTAAISR